MTILRDIFVGVILLLAAPWLVLSSLGFFLFACDAWENWRRKR